jgi:hypothetical protein
VMRLIQRGHRHLGSNPGSDRRGWHVSFTFTIAAQVVAVQGLSD